MAQSSLDMMFASLEPASIQRNLHRKMEAYQWLVYNVDVFVSESIDGREMFSASVEPKSIATEEIRKLKAYDWLLDHLRNAAMRLGKEASYGYQILRDERKAFFESVLRSRTPDFTNDGQIAAHLSSTAPLTLDPSCMQWVKPGPFDPRYVSMHPAIVNSCLRYDTGSVRLPSAEEWHNGDLKYLNDLANELEDWPEGL